MVVICEVEVVRLVVAAVEVEVWGGGWVLVVEVVVGWEAVVVVVEAGEPTVAVEVVVVVVHWMQATKDAVAVALEYKVSLSVLEPSVWQVPEHTDQVANWYPP